MKDASKARSTSRDCGCKRGFLIMTPSTGMQHASGSLGHCNLFAPSAIELRGAWTRNFEEERRSGLSSRNVQLNACICSFWSYAALDPLVPQAFHFALLHAMPLADQSQNTFGTHASKTSR